MAERRLRTILLHLSPPLTSSSSCSTEIPGASPSSFRSSGGSHKCILDGSPQPSHRTMSSSCDYSHLCHSMERSNSDEDPNQIGGEKSAGGEELESGNNKELYAHGKSLRFTYRGPFGNTEAALLVFSLRSKMQGLVIGQRPSEVNDQLVVEICRGGQIAVDNVRECKDDREYGGVIIDDVGVSTKDKWVVIEAKDVELNTGTRKASGEEKKEREDNQSCRSSEGNSESLQQRHDQFHQEKESNSQREIEKEIGVNGAVATGYRGPERVRGLVRADTTSSDAVSKKGNLQGKSLSGGLDLSMQKSKSRSGGQGKGVREATCVFCDIIHGAAPCLKVKAVSLSLFCLSSHRLSSFSYHLQLLWFWVELPLVLRNQQCLSSDCRLLCGCKALVFIFHLSFARLVYHICRSSFL